ncbi:hypothetical protein [Streptomyces sp. NBC_00582]|uniref:hypothetical protein n=1 Tax=Streptomyces sp. NBC_00582 TaxID=2975783 RepID=UPI002E7FC0FF|nr:hypothetical protein [Streptomyces sp. NBC_00582]WUB63855.1 hypothetical protein OG852_27415 [Streptomyces sp. NBC_00582]
MNVRADIAELLRAGVPQVQIARRLHVGPVTVQRTREALGLPSPGRGHRPAPSFEDAFRKNTEALDDGHVRWTGYRDKDGTPRVFHRRRPMAAPRAAFLLHYGREPVGKPLPTCRLKGCIAGEHLADRPMREANQRADALFAAIFEQPA